MNEANAWVVTQQKKTTTETSPPVWLHCFKYSSVCFDKQLTHHTSQCIELHRSVEGVRHRTQQVCVYLEGVCHRTQHSYECLKNEVSCFPDFQVALSYPSQELA